MKHTHSHTYKTRKEVPPYWWKVRFPIKKNTKKIHKKYAKISNPIEKMYNFVALVFITSLKTRRKLTKKEPLTMSLTNL